jgi:hypothetical protein
VGTLTTADQTWFGGSGSYQWQMNDANGAPGTGYDQLVINGALNISASSGSPFVIKVASLNGAVAGNAANFDNTTPKSWTLLTTTGGITGFDPTYFDVNTSGFSNPLGGAYFTVSLSGDGNSLLLNLVIGGVVGTGTGVLGSYYNTPGEGTSPASIPDPPALTRVDSTINFNWGTGSPAPVINNDHFVVRWTGFVEPMFSQTYTFIANTDDGVRLWVNGQEIINDWVDKGASDVLSTPIALVAGQQYGLVMEYYENTVAAAARLSWSTPDRGPEIIPQTQLYPSTAQLPFAVSADGTQMTMSWIGTFTLETATSVTGPWTPLTQSSPYTATIDTTQPAMFFRLVSQ